MKNNMIRVLLVLTAGLVVALSGCGGGGGAQTALLTNGSYSLTYTGSYGAVQFSVLNGVATGAGIDSSGSEEEFPVTGTLNQTTGALDLTGVGAQHTFTFTGNISNGTWSSTSGDSGHCSAARRGDPGDVTKFEGPWGGTWTDTQHGAGKWTATVQHNGVVRAQIQDRTGIMRNAVGVVTGSGAMIMGVVDASGTIQRTFTTETVVMTATTVQGTIRDTFGFNGTWTGTNPPPPL
jgi:hypothetical protein